MKKTALLLLLIISFSCGKEKTNLTVNVDVKGLKKGTAYLHKVQDTALTIIDSVTIKGDSKFTFNQYIEEPEVYYLSLDKNDNDNSYITFFADKGITDITTSAKYFYYDAKVVGTKQQDVLAEYNKMIDKFNSKSLDLIKSQFEAKKINDSTTLDSLIKVENNYTKSKYLFTVNYAINNKGSEVAPYLALNSIYDANVTFLDTIYKSLTKDVKVSKYGAKLKVYIDDIKKNEATKNAN